MCSKLPEIKNKVFDNKTLSLKNMTVKTVEELNHKVACLYQEKEKHEKKIEILYALLADTFDNFIKSDAYPYSVGEKYYFFKAGKSVMFPEMVGGAHGIVEVTDMRAVNQSLVQITVTNPENGFSEILETDYYGKRHKKSQENPIWTMVHLTENEILCV